MKTYTVQKDSHNNYIVCGDTTPRKGYSICYTATSYKEATNYVAYARHQ